MNICDCNKVLHCCKRKYYIVGTFPEVHSAFFIVLRKLILTVCKPTAGGCHLRTSACKILYATTHLCTASRNAIVF